MTLSCSRRLPNSSSELVFIHTRKNAGSSIIHFFESLWSPFQVVLEPNFLDRQSELVTFGVARNPYDRCLSSWQYCNTTRYRPLLDVLERPPKKDDIDPDPERRPGHDYRHFTLKQSDFLFSTDRTRRATEILRFENLEQELYMMCDKYGVARYGIRLQHLNKGPRVSYKLSDREKDAIYAFYQEDFHNLGYDR